jgi:hypothetical protein
MVWDNENSDQTRLMNEKTPGVISKIQMHLNLEVDAGRHEAAPALFM